MNDAADGRTGGVGRGVGCGAALALALAAGGLAGCGDAVVDGWWLGEPLYRIEGWVGLESGLGPVIGGERAPGVLRVGVFWAPSKGRDFDFEGAVEQEVSAAGTFPARFRITLYAPPPDDLLRDVTDGEGRLAQGLLLAYLDQDSDQAWDREGEPVVGGAPQRVFLYTPDGATSPTYGALAPGFHRVVPTGECTADGSGGSRFAADPVADVDLVVSMAFPVEALLDVDCDGRTDEWSGVCPPPDHIRMVCAEGGPEDPMCATCLPYMWQPGTDPVLCDAWFDRCLYTYPAGVCEGEWHLCRGEDPPAGAEACADLPCTCQRMLDECMALGAFEADCMTRFEVCMAP